MTRGSSGIYPWPGSAAQFPEVRFSFGQGLLASLAIRFPFPLVFDQLVLPGLQQHQRDLQGEHRTVVTILFRVCKGHFKGHFVDRDSNVSSGNALFLAADLLVGLTDVGLNLADFFAGVAREVTSLTEGNFRDVLRGSGLLSRGRGREGQQPGGDQSRKDRSFDSHGCSLAKDCGRSRKTVGANRNARQPISFLARSAAGWYSRR
jgi:hypothetical protein